MAGDNTGVPIHQDRRWCLAITETDSDTIRSFLLPLGYLAFFVCCELACSDLVQGMPFRFHSVRGSDAKA